jgi:uncharacterized protein DUF6883
MASVPKHARVDAHKVRAYLLSPTHPVGRLKARALAALGFDEVTADHFIAEVLRIAAEEGVSDSEHTVFGWKIIVTGELHGPAGVAPILTTWVKERRQPYARLVTVDLRTP